MKLRFFDICQLFKQSGFTYLYQIFLKDRAGVEQGRQ